MMVWSYLDLLENIYPEFRHREPPIMLEFMSVTLLS
jgi:hypothetical protein